MEVGIVVHPLDMVQVVAVALVVLVMVVQPTRVVTVVMEHRFQQHSEIQVTLPLETPLSGGGAGTGYSPMGAGGTTGGGGGKTSSPAGQHEGHSNTGGGGGPGERQ